VDGRSGIGGGPLAGPLARPFGSKTSLTIHGGFQIEVLCYEPANQKVPGGEGRKGRKRNRKEKKRNGGPELPNGLLMHPPTSTHCCPGTWPDWGPRQQKNVAANKTAGTLFLIVVYPFFFFVS